MSFAQFNLLPNAKLAVIRAQRQRAQIVRLATLITAASFGLLVLSFLWAGVVQKKQLSDSKKKVAAAVIQVNSTPNLDKMLTVQNQLQSLASLHQAKHVSSRIFAYLPALTPADVKVGRLVIDYAAGTLEMDGTADSQRSVSGFIATLKEAKYKIGADTPKNAFSSVIETSFSLEPGSSGYSLNMRFDPQLFTNSVDGQGNRVIPVIQAGQTNTAPDA